MEKKSYKFEVKKSFFVREVKETLKGEEKVYMRAVKPGETVELDDDYEILSLIEAECIEPYKMPETTLYEVRRAISFKTPTGVISLNPGNRIMLEKKEALSRLVTGEIKPMDESIYYPYLYRGGSK